MQNETRGSGLVTRCGTVAIVGKPNAGKSTLLNALVGEPIAIVSAKPQATREPVVGIWSDDRNAAPVSRPARSVGSSVFDASRDGRSRRRVSVGGGCGAVPHAAGEFSVVPLSEMEPRFAEVDRPLAYVFTMADQRSGSPPAGCRAGLCGVGQERHRSPGCS